MPKPNATNVEQNKSDINSELAIVNFAIKSDQQKFYSALSEISEEHFFDKTIGSIFTTVTNLYEKEGLTEISVSAIAAYARNSGVWETINKETFSKILSYVDGEDCCSEQEAILASKKVKHWFVIRKLNKKLKDAQSFILETNGDENIVDVITKVEETVFNFIPEIKRENDFTNLSNFAIGHIEYVVNNPVTMAEIPTGFPRYDACIGGGLRRGTVNVVGARPKVGKSTFCLNVAKNVSYANIPVLYLDTEMKKETQSIKWASLCSGVSQNEIETGHFASSERSKALVESAIDEFKNKPFYHVSIAGMKPQEIFSICRRWISSVVGKNNDGSVKDCLIILDYLKTMDLGDLGDFQEYQYLGDLITKLHNFSVKQDLPILATVQLNRDGINKEDTSVVSGSDRILWLCSSLAYLKKKTDEDIAAGDSKNNGDRKMVVIETRYGKGMDSSSEYINIVSDMDKSRFTEGKFNFEVLDDNGNSDDTETDFDF